MEDQAEYQPEANPFGVYVTREVRFVIGDQQTDVYVFVEGDKNCPEHVPGWHVKRFPTAASIEEVFKAMCSEDSPLFWPPAEPTPLMLTKTDLVRGFI